MKKLIIFIRKKLYKKSTPYNRWADNNLINVINISKIYRGAIIDQKNNIWLENIKILPKNVIFNNTGDVYLYFLKKLNNTVIFNNTGFICLNKKIDLSELNTTQINIIYKKLIENDNFLSKKDLLPLLRERKLNKIL